MRFEKRIAPLLKKRDKSWLSYGKLLREADSKKDRNEFDSIYAEAVSENGILQMEIDTLITHELTREAEQLFLPVPAKDDERYWKECDIMPRARRLSAAGISLLRDSIRDERKKRREVRLAYIEVTGKVVAMLTGLVGACIGLVTILKR